jgi:hypothetical protein
VRRKEKVICGAERAGSQMFLRGSFPEHFENFLWRFHYSGDMIALSEKKDDFESMSLPFTGSMDSRGWEKLPAVAGL